MNNMNIQEKSQKVRGFLGFVESLPKLFIESHPHKGDGQDSYLKNLETPTDFMLKIDLNNFQHKVGKNVGDFFEVTDISEESPTFRFYWHRNMRCVFIIHPRYTQTQLADCEGLPQLTW